MDDYIKREKDILRSGIQEAFLCSEFAIKYLDQGLCQLTIWFITFFYVYFLFSRSD